MRLIETLLSPLIGFIAEVLTTLWMDLEKLPLPFLVSRTGHANPRVRRISGWTGYWAHTFRLTIPNIRTWMKTRGDLFPRVVQVQTINRCNAACDFCPYPYTVHLQEKRIMDDDLYSKIVDECVREPGLLDFVPMSKNEPLLDLKMEERIREFRSKAQPHQIVELVTNGSALTPARAKRLMDAGLDMLTVSISAANEETYNKVMVGLSWKQLMNNLEALSRENLSKMNVYLRFIKERGNRRELKVFRKRWKLYNLFNFDVNNRAGALRGYEMKVIPHGDMIERMKHMAGSRIYPGCPYVFSSMHILENGDVTMCLNDWADREVIGNVRTQTIREIYNAPRMKEVRELMSQGRYEEIEACRGCSIYHEWLKPLEVRQGLSWLNPLAVKKEARNLIP
jgi:radical SAM protein with 4Fe4S-binding SPASM domain